MKTPNNTKSVSEYLKVREEVGEDHIRHILGDKQPSRTEIEVSFFQYCNYKCNFCWQDTDSVQGLEDIPKKAKIVNQYLRESKSLKEEINVTLTGGELFQDSLTHLLDDYFNFISEIVTKNTDKKIVFTLISNLSFNSETRAKIKTFIGDIEDLYGSIIRLTTSWDPVGRPTKNFLSNIEFFKESLAGITMVMTKPNIDFLLRKESELFDYMYKNFDLDFDYYVPTKRHDTLMPSDKNILDFMYFLDSKYPNNNFSKRFSSEGTAELSCGNLNKITILPDGNLTACRQVSYSEEEFRNKINYSSNSNIITSFIDKYDCFSCEFFKKCPLTCFVMNDHISYKEELNECLYKKYFKNKEIK